MSTTTYTAFVEIAVDFGAGGWTDVSEDVDIEIEDEWILDAAKSMFDVADVEEVIEDVWTEDDLLEYINNRFDLNLEKL